MSDRESGDEQSQVAQRGSDEEELASKTLQIQSKRFYLDVKQNRRGRFIKIAEVGAGGKKSRLLLAMSTAAEFRDHLTDFSEHYASLGPPTSEGIPEDGKLKSEVMVKDNRRYYLDLKENQRGRFLRVSMTTPLSRQRSQVAIPAQGMIEIRDALTDLLNEFGSEDQETQDDLPEPQSLRVENKMFYFDVGHNRRGTFMRISEVRSNFRAAITIPERSWARFRDVVADFASKQMTSASSSSQQAVPPLPEEGPASVGVTASPAGLEPSPRGGGSAGDAGGGAGDKEEAVAVAVDNAAAAASGGN
jgi:hypothetical protein